MKLAARSVRLIILVTILVVSLLCLTACQESTSSKYEKANKLLTEGKYTEAAVAFDEISTYEDASKLSLYAKAINAAENGDYETALSTFSSLGDYKDCRMLNTYYSGRQAEESVYDGASINGSKWFEAIEKYETNPLFLDSKERAEACRKAAYDQAIQSGDNGDTDFAIWVFKELGSYSDAGKQIVYYEASALRKEGNYKSAYEKYSIISGFRDTDELATVALDEGYNAALALEEAGDLDGANALFLDLGDYRDSAIRAYKLYYDAGVKKREAKDWDGAVEAFLKAGSYSNAQEEVKETKYMQAEELYKQGDYKAAYLVYVGIRDYKNVSEKLNTDSNLLLSRGHAFVSENKVNFRDSPSKASRVITKLNKYALLDVIDTEEIDGITWVHALFNDVEGYMVGTYVKILSDEEYEVFMNSSQYQEGIENNKELP